MSALYRDLLALLPPVVLPPWWDFLPPDEECRGPSSDGSALLAKLERDHHIGILLNAGIAECDDNCDEGPTLAPALTRPAAVIIGQRGSDPALPVGIHTTDGPLGKTPWLSSELQERGRIATQVCNTGLLFTTLDILEVAILRKLRLPAIPWPGWRAVPHCLELLEAIARDRAKGAAPHAKVSTGRLSGSYAAALAGVKPLLLICGWSLATMDRAPHPRLQHAIAALNRAGRTLGQTVAGVVVWQPPADVVAELRWGLASRNPALVRQLLLETTDYVHDCERWAAGAAGERVRPATLTDLRDDHVAALTADPATASRSEQREAQRRYDDAIARDLVAPLVDKAQVEGDASARANAAVLATLSTLALRNGPIVEAALPRDAGEALRTGRLLPKTMWRQYSQMLSRLDAAVRKSRR